MTTISNFMSPVATAGFMPGTAFVLIIASRVLRFIYLHCHRMDLGVFIYAAVDVPECRRGRQAGRQGFSARYLSECESDSAHSHCQEQPREHSSCPLTRITPS